MRRYASWEVWGWAGCVSASNVQPLRAGEGAARMLLMVHVKGKAIAVSCGDGRQPVRWLANVGMARFDEAQGRSLGQPVGVKLEDGTTLSLGQTLSDAGLRDQQHVWIVFKAHRIDGPQKKGQHAEAADDDDDD